METSSKLHKSYRDDGLILKIDNEFYKITPDPYCWILYKQLIREKDGKKYWHNPLYFSNIFQIVKYLYDQGCKELEIGSINELESLLLLTAKKLEQTLTDLGIERKLKKYHS